MCMCIYIYMKDRLMVVIFQRYRMEIFQVSLHVKNINIRGIIKVKFL